MRCTHRIRWLRGSESEASWQWDEKMTNNSQKGTRAHSFDDSNEASRQREIDRCQWKEQRMSQQRLPIQEGTDIGRMNENCRLLLDHYYAASPTTHRLPKEDLWTLGECSKLKTRINVGRINTLNLMHNIKQSARTDENIAWSTEGSKRVKNE